MIRYPVHIQRDAKKRHDMTGPRTTALLQKSSHFTSTCFTLLVIFILYLAGIVILGASDRLQTSRTRDTSQKLFMLLMLGGTNLALAEIRRMRSLSLGTGKSTASAGGVTLRIIWTASE